MGPYPPRTELYSLLDRLSDGVTLLSTGKSLSPTIVCPVCERNVDHGLEHSDSCVGCVTALAGLQKSNQIGVEPLKHSGPTSGRKSAQFTLS